MVEFPGLSPVTNNSSDSLFRVFSVFVLLYGVAVGVVMGGSSEGG